jgi:putative oxidoreductase
MTDTAPAAAPRSHSMIGAAVDVINGLCAVVPYAVVALIIRVAMARIFFRSGQKLIEGPIVPIDLKNFAISVTLPAHVKAATFDAFHAAFASAPFSPAFAAYVFSYAEFFLPLLLVIGFATRLSAAILFILTILIQIYLEPGVFWAIHVNWFALLLVLMTCGAGAVSIDHLIRFFAAK